ncbi:MAG: hypothetical protein M1829_001117 [Trizodia sp. TS-e1964]|nr:MAG: hypothetical protein M1829_001117 [Trizodia sp. TS-e1964]
MPPAPSLSDTNLPLKRNAAAAGLPKTPSGRTVKRRASKACQCCRARKVRCNVVEHGPPCTNCRLDEIECVVAESKRRRKLWAPKPQSLELNPDEAAHEASNGYESQPLHGEYSASTLSPISPPSLSLDSASEVEYDSQKISHMSYLGQEQNLMLQGHQTHAFSLPSHSLLAKAVVNYTLLNTDATSTGRPSKHQLPGFIKPLPSHLTSDDAEYLWHKGVLSVPQPTLRQELLRSYIDFVHGYMPLLELHSFLGIVNQPYGEHGRLSLLLFQSVMFAGTAFVDMRHLLNAGFSSRRAARKSFFYRARLLYDFDYESDRITLVQSLLLMTYWYEAPDDQKDTWHWLGVALSLCHTIGLHRNPENSQMSIDNQRLWKRIWWSCFIRDKLVALGMRRPSRIKIEDYNVPMLTIDDFELGSVAADISCIPSSCVVARDVVKQRKLALMCIEKAKLCLCISHVLSAQYSVLNSEVGPSMAQGNTRATMMLLPNKLDAKASDIQICSRELSKWITELPEDAKYETSSSLVLDPEADLLTVHRAVIHMIYHTALSTLHRPQALPSLAVAIPSTAAELQDESRRIVRLAANEITRVARDLQSLNLVRYLPTTGVTVLLPAIIVHLLDVKSSCQATREASLKGFSTCIQVMHQLRDNYAAADSATQFLEAAVQRAGLQAMPSLYVQQQGDPMGMNHSLNAGKHAAKPVLTPPPEIEGGRSDVSPPRELPDHYLARQLNFFLVQSPPDLDPPQIWPSDEFGDPGVAANHYKGIPPLELGTYEFDNSEFEALIDFSASAEPPKYEGQPVKGESQILA